jgi:hypothetical protein
MHDLFRHEPQFMKKLFLTFSPQELQAVINAEKDYTGNDLTPELKKLGL